jgi:hypothetical protein
LDFGHFRPEVPETLHVGAYPRIFTLATRGIINLESPANWLDRGLPGAVDRRNCHAEGPEFESQSPFRERRRSTGVDPARFCCHFVARSATFPSSRCVSLRIQLAEVPWRLTQKPW